MVRNEARRMTAEKKLRVVEDGRQSGATKMRYVGSIKFSTPSVVVGRGLPDKKP
jgi:dihydroxyacid dehydratase/phosphogluconate dehydratase